MNDELWTYQKELATAHLICISQFSILVCKSVWDAFRLWECVFFLICLCANLLSSGNWSSVSFVAHAICITGLLSTFLFKACVGLLSVYHVYPKILHPLQSLASDVHLFSLVFSNFDDQCSYVQNYQGKEKLEHRYWHTFMELVAERTSGLSS